MDEDILRFRGTERDATLAFMTQAYAFDIRDAATGSSLGNGVAVPADRYLMFRSISSMEPVIPPLSDDVWSELTSWTVESDEGLPKQPPPMPIRVVRAIVDSVNPDVDPMTLITRRLGVVPVAPTISRLLLGFSV